MTHISGLQRCDVAGIDCQNLQQSQSAGLFLRAAQHCIQSDEESRHLCSSPLVRESESVFELKKKLATHH